MWHTKSNFKPCIVQTDYLCSIILTGLSELSSHALRQKLIKRLFEIQSGIFYGQSTQQGKLPVLQTAEQLAQGQAECKDRIPAGHGDPAARGHSKIPIHDRTVHSPLLSWQEGEAREAAGKLEQIFKES